MKLFDKILLGLLSTAALLAGVILTMCALDWGFHLHLSHGGTLLFVILAAVLVLLSVRMFFVVFKKKKAEGSVQVQTSELGTSYMSYGAIEGVIRRQLSLRLEVKGVQVHLALWPEDKLSIDLKLTILPDVPVAPFVVEVQQGLKTYLENICGVKVGSISIVVENAVAGDNGGQKAIAAPRVK